MNKIIKLLLILVGGIMLLGAILLTWLTVTDFKPEAVDMLSINNNSKLNLPSTFTIFNWNIGYGALGEDVDFFFDGGEIVITPEDKYNKYINGITEIIGNTDADIFYFQEVDIKSKRSQYDNQLKRISDKLPNYSTTFGTNYDVSFIPPPGLFKTALGKVHAGLATFSEFKMDKSERVSLPGNYSWPKRILFLDRCMVVTRMTTENNKNVVLINTHNSAYDKGGFIKQNQLEFIKTYALKEYTAGNYVIIGGDWNSYMPGAGHDTFISKEGPAVYNEGLPNGWGIEGWKWGTDITIPTNRSLKTPYIRGQNFLCVIDGFLVSPNLNIKDVITHDLGFRYSDHNPVEITLELN